MASDVTVEQRDRDAFAEAYRGQGCLSAAIEIESGYWDEHWGLQAFARHRLAAETIAHSQHTAALLASQPSGDVVERVAKAGDVLEDLLDCEEVTPKAIADAFGKVEQALVSLEGAG